MLTCVTQARRLGLWVLAEEHPHVAAPAHSGAVRIDVHPPGHRRAGARKATVHWGRPGSCPGIPDRRRPDRERPRHHRGVPAARRGDRGVGVGLESRSCRSARAPTSSVRRPSAPVQHRGQPLFGFWAGVVRPIATALAPRADHPAGLDRGPSNRLPDRRAAGVPGRRRYACRVAARGGYPARRAAHASRAITSSGWAIARSPRIGRRSRTSSYARSPRAFTARPITLPRTHVSATRGQTRAKGHDACWLRAEQRGWS